MSSEYSFENARLKLRCPGMEPSGLFCARLSQDDSV